MHDAGWWLQFVTAQTERTQHRTVVRSKKAHTMHNGQINIDAVSETRVLQFGSWNASFFQEVWQHNALQAPPMHSRSEIGCHPGASYQRGYHLQGMMLVRGETAVRVPYFANCLASPL